MSFANKYRQGYGDIYRFHEKHFKAVTETEWEELIADSTALYAKYRENKLIVELIVAVMHEIEMVNFPENFLEQSGCIHAAD